MECKDVEKDLQRHIQNLIEEDYIKPLVKKFTGIITDDVPTVLLYMFQTYGKVRGEEVKQKEAEVLSLTWLPSDPLVTLTRPIELLQKFALQAGLPYTNEQVLEFGLQLIRNTRDFEAALTTWNARPVNQKTWANFKTHFHQAQETLKEVRGPTMQQAGYHHANSPANRLCTELQARDQ